MRLSTDKQHDLLPVVILLTGLSGSGKTTIALALKEVLIGYCMPVIHLDGDDVRAGKPHIGFDEASRKNHNLSIIQQAASFEKAGSIVILSLIAPYRETRLQMRLACKNFIEVYVSADIPTCISRDVKGLYAKALAGKIDLFTGITAPYEAPLHPELTLETNYHSLEECITLLLACLPLKAALPTHY